MQFFWQQLQEHLHVFLLAMTPIVELRGAIPLGAIQGLPWWSTYLFAVAGNMIPVIPIILGLRKVLALLYKIPALAGLAAWVEDRLHRKAHQKNLQRYSLVALFVFVAIPLPGTGAWTGSAIAALLDMRLRHALPAIFFGVLVAGFLMSGISYGFLGFLQIFSV